MYRSHWSERVRETIIRRTHDGLLNLKIRGGAELGNFPYFGKICDDDIIYESENRLAEGINKEGCIFPVVIRFEFCMRQYRGDHHREDASHCRFFV